MILEFNSRVPPLFGLPDAGELRRKTAVALVSEADRDHNSMGWRRAFSACRGDFGMGRICGRQERFGRDGAGSLNRGRRGE